MKRLSKVMAALLAVTVSAGATGSIAYANSRNEKGAEQAPESEKKTAYADRKDNGERASKDETVYVLCNNDSSVKKVVVSDWLKNSPALASLSDVSDLSDIINVKGDEALSISGAHLNWEADGDDIYYKGYSDKALPVDVTMDYFLDGKKVEPASIKGKSGHLVIRWTYKNKQKVTKLVNGKEKELYVPFMVASAAVLSTDSFLNVEVTNGKILSDGEKLIAVGMAFPGLRDSIDLSGFDGIDVDIPDSFEISADVRNFEMNTSVTVVSNEIFSKLDVDGAVDLNELRAKVKELSDGAEKLENGTASLYDGIKQLGGGTGNLTAGIDRLLSGSLELKNGAAELDDGAKKLSDGAKTLSDSSGKFEEGLCSAKEGSAKLADGLGQVSGGAAQLSDGLGGAKSGSEALVEGLGKLSAGAEALSGGIDDAKKGSDALEAGFAQVNEGAAALKTGADTLTCGVGALADGSKQVKDGSAQISTGAAAISEGASKLSESVGQVSAGIGSAKSGADALAEGITSAKTGADSLTAGA
ncbi:MAG: hypothetical protein J5724_00275, partial [Ruminococcus sp.]|nr:hypothetical protein [Ruminococcus sp.]